MKKKVGIIIVIIFSIFCICMGIKTRKENAINVTQIQTQNSESLSYMLKTKKNNIVMIDGGGYEDSAHLEEVLIENGGVVAHWYITLAHSNNFGALQKIIENGKVKVENIYISFNSIEWYEQYEFDRVTPIAEFFSVLNEKKQVYAEVPENFEIHFDNLYVSVLNMKNAEFNGEYAGFNTYMIIKVDNMYKSIIFMGDVANQAGEYFKNNNLDEIDCEAVQVSNNGMQYVDNEIYKKMKPKYLLMPIPATSKIDKAREYVNNLKSILNAKELYLSCDGDNNLIIW